MKKVVLAIGTLAILAGCAEIRNSNIDQSKVGPGPLGSTVPTGEVVNGVGLIASFEGRPVDLAVTTDQKTVWIKDFNVIRAIDVISWKEVGKADIPGGASLTGIIVSAKGDRLYVSNATNKILEYDSADPANPKLIRQITVAGPEGKGNSFPCGLTFLPGEQRLLVALSINNSIGILDLSSEKVVKEIPVGIAPFGVALSKSLNKAVVTNQGGPIPKSGEKTAPSAGTETRIDDRGIAYGGSVSIIDLETESVKKEIPTGLQPTAITLSPDGKTAFVAETNYDSVTSINVQNQEKIKTYVVKPDAKLPFGSQPAALTISPDGQTLYAALSGNNAVAVIPINSDKPAGFIPTDWMPYGVAVCGDDILILNNKGKGARTDPVPTGKPLNSHNKNGTIQKVLRPSATTLANYTQQVMAAARVPAVLAAFERSTNASAPPVPIPAKLGEPSLFKHVIYVIKENRTYDQMFGDLPNADGDPNLNIFKDDVIPNQRNIARQFVLLDNYYCNGVLSADGHSWATEGNVTPYLNRAFGGFTRSYTFGDDPITYSSSGFIWDGVLAAGLSFRNYGEFNYSEPAVKGKTGKEIWDDYVAKKPQKFTVNIGVENVKRYSNLEAPGWNMNIPDQIRMDVFLKEFREFEAKGDLPNLITIYLPQDHTGGAVSARSNVADNDLAVGRLVEAVTKSRFYKDTVLFINEDDPQAGTDHVDGHRSICLVVSPYSRRLGTVSTFYNQTSVLHSISQIFGIAPLNQRTAFSDLMTKCFSTNADLTPFSAEIPKTPLDEFPSKSQMSSQELSLYTKVKQIDLTKREVQTPREMDVLNRWVWHSQKGFDVPYPTEWAGAHGRGLSKRGLKLGAGVEDDD